MDTPQNQTPAQDGQGNTRLEERVLHVDEDTTTQDFVRRIFAKNEIQVNSAYSYRTAEEFLGSNLGKYTGLVISANLYAQPGENGLDIASLAIRLGFNPTKYPLVIVAPKDQLEQVKRNAEEYSLSRCAEFVEEDPSTEAPDENKLIAIFSSRRGL